MSDLRPRSRVRHMDSPDLAVINGGAATWLADSRNVVCLLGCGTVIAITEPDLAEAIRQHRETCSP